MRTHDACDLEQDVFLYQGVLSGISAALNYGIGVLAYWLWVYLELPRLRGRALRAARIATLAACFVIAVVFPWKTLEWQNSILTLPNARETLSALRPELFWHRA